jgi:predicted nucleic acid-binding protein
LFRVHLLFDRFVSLVALTSGETLNWIHSWKRQQTAVETDERLNRSTGFKMYHAAQKDFTRAIELFDTSDGLSCGDATIVASMQQEGSSTAIRSMMTSMQSRESQD